MLCYAAVTSLWHFLRIRYDTIDDLHWKTDLQAASSI